MLKVTVAHRTTGETYYLKSTIWTRNEESASTFATRDEALAALARAMKFSKPIAFKRTYTDPVLAEREA